ncbi:type II toxin-antitoxin system HipA family toxin [Dokdonella fugitiva]|jgi:serine/threonine-protein kinase HipA|uniref:Serine/threonine-protein kinase HipA n=1 Tax=Dokdonella fugitiva TaxID=328517 RepID=A0A4R2HUL2_9GAMM|nr:HipA domain-containing protein [Dokdonella fugitiva]MBA8885744.1 serine/threonine-protein kinase HipA [Dokdonella fugitiva]TCO34729.1 serine/threonine-protein kinase HipA [Dokdonella fugitiva]
MISDRPGNTPREAYVWTWLPARTEPVVAGRLVHTAQGLQFNYGRSYLARDDRLPLYLPELPLQPGLLPLPTGLAMPGCLRDAAPDAWGRRIILNRLLGSAGRNADTVVLDELDYLLQSGSNRIGALDFQASATTYMPRGGGDASLEELQESAERVERGLPLSPALAQAIQHGTSIGGARPKVALISEGRQWIAKFSASSDVQPVVKMEFIAMRLAALVGLDVAPVQRVRAANKDVLLVERFDRMRHADGRWRRRSLVSALTLMGLDEMMAAYASYEELAEIIRHRFVEPKATLRELFARLVFNILCGNTDDHARNHAAFWDGESLSLTPAYDICPQSRVGQEATQAMKILGDNRFSRLTLCVEAADRFLLSKAQARGIIDAQRQILIERWRDVCEEAELGEAERNALWGRQFLNPFALQDYA